MSSASRPPVVVATTDHVLIKNKGSEKIIGKQNGTQIKLEANESHYPIFRDLGVKFGRGAARFSMPHTVPQVLNLFSRYGYRVVSCASCGTENFPRMCWTLAKEISPS
ncbi:hypothetical protein AAVH_27901 [Aphelenchoides avenae]|nr:hypothetical protein AAVH_27901 [Aphelenchus avenae]